MTKLSPSRGMSFQLQLSSSCSVLEIGVKSILSPKSMTCTRVTATFQTCLRPLTQATEFNSVTIIAFIEVYQQSMGREILTWNSEASSWYPSSLLRITRRNRLICNEKKDFQAFCNRQRGVLAKIWRADVLQHTFDGEKSSRDS